MKRIERMRNVVMALFLGLLLTGCAGLHSGSKPSAEAVRQALEQPTPERKVSALQVLREDASGERLVALQSLITLYALESIPQSAADRKVFQREAKVLAEQAGRLPLYRVPTETGVLLYLAGLDPQGMLSAQTRVVVDRYCSEDKIVSDGSGSLSRQTLVAAQKALATSCWFYVQGDLKASTVALAEALRWQLSAREQVVPQGVEPSLAGGWDIFKRRLVTDVGMSLNAAETKLQN